MKTSDDPCRQGAAPTRGWLIACHGLLLCAVPAQAWGQTKDQADLVRRVADLEAELAELKAALGHQRNSTSLPAGKDTSAAPVSSGIDQPRGKGPDASIRLSGFVKLDMIMSSFDGGTTATNPLGRDYYLPSAIPVETGKARSFDGHAKQTRLALTASKQVGGRPIDVHVEADFQGAPGTQGSERTTNGYNAALRRAFISYGGWTVGQDWTTFQYLPALPETADFIGPVEGTVFVRQAQVRREFGVGQKFLISIGAENAETASSSSTSPALVENDSDQLPDLAARVIYRSGIGDISLAGVARQLAVRNGASHLTGSGWGISLAGKMPIGSAGRHDLRFMLSGGSGIGRYLGLNLAPDAILVGSGDEARLKSVQVIAGFLAARYHWSQKWRSTLMGSFQLVDYHEHLAPLGANRSVWSAAFNLFYSPVALLDLGLEVRHAEREVVGGAKGNMDRLHFVVKQTF